MKQTQTGQSLIEVIVMLAVVVMVVTGLVVGTVSSLKVTTFSSNKSQGTKYAQEGMELVRKDRDTSWSTFLARSGRTYCIPSGGDAWTESNSCLVNIDTGTSQFTRSAQFTWDGTSTMTVTVTVSWQDGGNTHTSQITSNFTKWR
jgi:Tfp pilus assembly protein PilV